MGEHGNIWPEDPWSTLTAIMYPLMGYLAYEVTRSAEGAVFAAHMAALGAGTGWRHWRHTPRSSTADQVTMHFVLASLVIYALGGPWWLMLVGGASAGWFLEKQYDLQLRPTMGLYVALILTALIARGQWPELAAFLAAMGIGFTTREAGVGKPNEDEYHGLGWHTATAIGLLIAFLAL